MEQDIEKEKSEMWRLEKCNSTLKEIIKKRQASPRYVEENEVKRVK